LRGKITWSGRFEGSKGGKKGGDLSLLCFVDVSTGKPPEKARANKTAMGRGREESGITRRHEDASTPKFN